MTSKLEERSKICKGKFVSLNLHVIQDKKG